MSSLARHEQLEGDKVDTNSGKATRVEQGKSGSAGDSTGSRVDR